VEYQLRLLGCTVAKKKKSRLKITQTRSGIGRQGKHRRTLRALGIKRHQQSVVHEDSPAIRGMISQISFMVDVHEVEG
jgi:large subunit ribosomal protein L30